ncbi:MAG: hypothetical protein LBG27_03150 [Spirochaetaceae bacterium]|jgi:hypothetical protein|nr:hypothetical protein [Spirochaetaceae bacterium]
MEELLSTDNIHREILDDAKRKAAKILKNAESAIAAAATDWDVRLQRAVGEVRARYDADIAEKMAEAKARLAMDKARSRLSKINGALEKAMRGFFQTLERKELLAVLERALAVRLAAVKAVAGKHETVDFSPVEVETCGLTKAEAETILGRLSLTATRINEIPAVDELPSIILWTGDIKMTASIQAEADALLLSKRAEVAEALFG